MPSAVTITAQPADLTVVEGGTAQFNVSATNATAYQWQRQSGSTWVNVDGATGPSFSLTAITPQMNGEQYRVVVSGNGGAITSSSATLRVNAIVVAASILVQPVARTVVEGQDASFMVTASGTSLSYRWQATVDGETWTDIAAASDATLVLPAVVPADSGKLVRVIVSNSAGALASSSAALTVDPAPRAPIITEQPANASVVAGQTVRFNMSAAGSPAPTVQWQTSTDGQSWSDVSGATESTYITASSTVNDSGRQYRALASNSSGTVASFAALLTVNPMTVTPAFVSQPRDATVAAGLDAVFSVLVVGTPTPTLQWQLSGDGSEWFNITGATATSYTAASVQLAASGTRYRVLASNSTGTQYSDIASLTVNPVIPSFSAVPQSVAVVAPAPATFSASAGGAPSPSYQWQQSSDGGTNWSNIVAATSSTYAIGSTDASRDNGLLLRVIASNSAGSAVSPAAALNVTTARMCTGASGTGWCWAHPLPQGNSLRGVASPTASLQVAVGLGGTIIRTTDGGQTWTAPASGTARHLYAVAFSDESVGVVVGAGGTILRTTDGGKTWSALASGTARDLLGVTFRGSTGLAVGASGSLLRTEDAGQTWTMKASATTEDLNAVSFGSTGVAVAVGGNGAIVRSTDSGQAWAPQSSGGTYPLNGISFASTTIGIAVGDNVILRTTDGGQTWATSSEGVTVGSLKAVAFEDATTGYATGGAQILITTDGGQHWGQMVYYPLGASTVFAVAFADGRNGVMVGSAGLMLEITHGGTFAAANAALTTYGFAGVSMADADTGVAVGPKDLILRTVDAGQSWSSVAIPGGAPMYGVSFPTPTIGVAVGASAILRTADAGLTWSSVGGVGSNLHSVAFGSATTGIAVGEKESILRTSDSGSSWTLVTVGLSSSTSRLLSAAWADANTAVAVGDSDSGAGSLMRRSADAGQTWIGVNPGTTEPLFGVAFASSTTGVAVGYGGTIVRTTDAGQHWTPVNSGTTAWLHGVSFTSASVGFAVGASGTVLRTADAGATWTPVARDMGDILTGVAGSSATHAVVVGDGASIIVTNTGGL